MNSKSLRYQHLSADPICEDGRQLRIESHADEHTAFLAIDDTRQSREGHPDPVAYISAEDVPSAVVALFASTNFTALNAPDETTAKLQQLAGQFIDVFREAMVPSFRDEFKKALDEAKDDWDAKCRVSDIINRYENLR